MPTRFRQRVAFCGAGHWRGSSLAFCISGVQPGGMGLLKVPRRWSNSLRTTSPTQTLPKKTQTHSRAQPKTLKILRETKFKKRLLKRVRKTKPKKQSVKSSGRVKSAKLSLSPLLVAKRKRLQRAITHLPWTGAESTDFTNFSTMAKCLKLFARRSKKIQIAGWLTRRRHGSHLRQATSRQPSGKLNSRVPWRQRV